MAKIINFELRRRLKRREKAAAKMELDRLETKWWLDYAKTIGKEPRPETLRLLGLEDSDTE